MIKQSSIDKLKENLDIVDIINSYIPLKKSGSSFKAPCPFHNEKTPSFVVNPNKQLFHCFGCKIGGDVIKFVMEYERLSYPQAIEKLANQYNIPILYTNGSKGNYKINKEVELKKLNILKILKNYYVDNLFNSNNKQILDYLQNRGISIELIKKFKIGYALNSNDTLQFLKSNFINIQDAIDVGVVGKGDNNIYARFINRIIFPIFNTQNILVGFGGRTITNHNAKYINTPATSYFNKSNLLYGFNLAKESIKKSNTMIITEGYIDTILLHQIGYTNSIATLGTALTTNHIAQIKKLDINVILAYDGDNAGLTAALKGAKLLSIANINGAVVLFNKNQDPADLIVNNKIDELKDIFSNTINLIKFVIDQIVLKYNLQDPLKQQSCIEDLIEYLKQLSYFNQEKYIKYILKYFKVGVLPIIQSRLNTKTNNQINNTKFIQKDLLELSLLKTMIENSSLKILISTQLTADMFEIYFNQYQQIIDNQIIDPFLRELILDDTITVFKDTDQLQTQLNLFKIKYYEKQIEYINLDVTVDFKSRVESIKLLRFKIEELKSFLKY